MVSFRYAAFMAVIASPLLAAAAAAPDTTPAPSSTIIKKPITTPTTIVPARAMVTKGCYNSSEPLENHGEYLYQSDGNCQLVCLQEKKNVLGLSDGLNCWCGDFVPAESSRVDDKKCNTGCGGDRTRFTCGGPGLLWVALSGNTLNDVPNYDPPASSSTSSTPSATAKPSATAAPSDDNKEEESKPNTVAIAVGVVVGILALAGIGFGVWFFLRRRRQRQAEEDYRRNAANVNAFVHGGKHTATSSLNDSRLDPSFMDRRTSNGSIADNEDFSRRILKVTNA